jgi:cytochrome c5
MNTQALYRVVTALAMAALVACGDPDSRAAPEAEAASRQLVPTDTALAAIYQRSCRSCHTLAATGAPLTGDAAAWAPRLDKGMDVLLENVINGFGGMPPLGLCMDCDAGQFEALVRFMAGEAAP